MTKRILQAVMSLALTASAFGVQTTFVSITGSDSNQCSDSSPCRTFQAALLHTGPGATLPIGLYLANKRARSRSDSGPSGGPKTADSNNPANPSMGYHTTTSCSSGAIPLRSSASLVTTACPALCAQMTTWASTISAVPVRANNRPTAVASGPSSGIRSVPACRTSRERRACLAGLRMACASAVAGIVIRMPRSAARAMSVSTRRSFRSRAISPPASKVMPFTPPSLFWKLSSVRGERETRRPTCAPFSLGGHPFAEGLLPASPSILPYRREQFQPHALRRQKRLPPLRPRSVREFLQSDCPRA